MLDQLISAQRMQQCLTAAERRMEPYWAAGDSHVEYFCGRWHGSNPESEARPLNLIAQTVRAFMPKLVPSRLRQVVKPQKGGQEIEATILGKLLERDDEEEDLIENVYDPCIAEAFFYPLAVTYTGLRPGTRSLEAEGIDMDPGEPFVEHIPQRRWVIDPFADSFRNRQWEAHKILPTREWLLASPAYQDPAIQEYIRNLPSWEDSDAGKKHLLEVSAGSIQGKDKALFDRVELWNVVIYHPTGIYEGTIAPEQSGAGDARWLRGVRWEGPDKGPYDHLTFQKVPRMLIPAAILCFCRDIAEAGDKLTVKGIDSAERSKKVFGYTGGDEDEADVFRTAPHGDTIRMNDANNGKVFDLSLNDPQLIGMIGFIQSNWNDAGSQPKQLTGSNAQDDTATEADIRNTRASEQIEYLLGKENAFMRSHSRKRGVFFLTDPVIDRTVAVASPDGEVIELAFNAANRVGTPQDYLFKCEVMTVASGSPELRARRVLEAVDVVGKNMPLFQAGIFDLPRTLRFLERHVADGLSEISGDPGMMMERMMMDEAAEGVHQRAASGWQEGGGDQAGTGRSGGMVKSGQDGARSMQGVRQSTQHAAARR